jgi:hypothetical protein
LRQTSSPDAEHVGFVARITLAVDRHLEAAQLDCPPAPDLQEMRLGKSA